MNKIKKYTIDSFFAGTGGIDLGFAQTKKFKTIYANEIDKYARKTFHLNFPKADLDGTDINKVNPSNIPDADVMVGGFPCQSFSIAGYRKGFKDPRGTLFFAMLKMITAHKPRAILCENVKNLVTHDHGNTFKVIREALVENGYKIKWHVLNTKDYGNVPQNRERIYIVGFRNKTAYRHFHFPKKTKLTKTIHDIIDFHSKLPEKYYYRQGKQPYYAKLKQAITGQNTLYQWRRKYVRANQSGVVPTMTANMGTGGSNVPLLLTDSHEIRKMTPRETFNAQGYPYDPKHPNGPLPYTFQLPNEANGRLYKQAGNAVSVPVIKRIATNIAKALSYDKKAGKHKAYQQESLFSTASVKNSNNSKYALIFSDMDGNFAGTSYISRFGDNIGKLSKDIKNSLLSDPQYTKLVKRNKKAKFYMIEKL